MAETDSKLEAGSATFEARMGEISAKMQSMGAEGIGQGSTAGTKTLSKDIGTLTVLGESSTQYD